MNSRSTTRRPPTRRSARGPASIGRVTARWLAGLGAGAGLCVSPTLATASPQGGKVVSGEATVTRDGSHTQIDTFTQKTIMTWRSFDIGRKESVHIEQPSVSSMILNQVQSATVTTINGSLTSNGQVWIANAGGIYIGGEAIVEVQGLVAAAGTISRRGFLSGEQRFRNVQGEVRNEGKIFADWVTLAGRSVANSGSIVARDGNLVMVAGDDIVVSRHHSHLQIQIASNLGSGPDGDPTQPSVVNTGRLEASGQAWLAAGDLLGVAIQNTGHIRAQEIMIAGGDQSIIEISGTLDASALAAGETGGKIEILGDWVLVEDALLDASGDAGGGSIFVGIDEDGENIARGTFIDEDTEIFADALRQGDGGEVVVFADEIALMHGTISAEGGASGGNGGFVETSAKHRIDISGHVYVGAEPEWEPGEWLIDPVNIEIVEMVESDPGPFIELLAIGNPTAVTYQPEGAPDPTPQSQDPESQTSRVASSTIEETLRRGSRVTITTETSDRANPGTAEGNIWVLADIVVAEGDEVRPGSRAALEMRAANHIYVREKISAKGSNLTLSVLLRANDNVNQAFVDGLSQNEPVSEQRIGDVIIDAEIQTNGGRFSATGANVMVNEAIDTTSTIDGEPTGGAVDFIAFDLAEFFPEIEQAYDGPEDAQFGKVIIDANVTTGGATFDVGGDDLLITTNSTIDATSTNETLPRDILVDVFGQVDIQGTLEAETISIRSGSDGVGDVILGSDEAAARLLATRIFLTAGDGVSDTPDDDNSLARVEFVNTQFTMPGYSEQDDGTIVQPFFRLAQDAAIVATQPGDLPPATAFTLGAAVPGDLSGLFMVLTTADGASEGPDVHLDPLGLDPAGYFEGVDLVILAPDSVQIDSELVSDSVQLVITEGFEVTSTLADRLRPTESLQIDAGTNGLDHLSFEQGVTLVAREIALRAGSGIGDANVSMVQFESDTQLVAPLNAKLSRLEIRQDAAIDDTALPAQNQIPGGLDDVPYFLTSDAGGIRLSDPGKVNGSRLTLLAAGELEIDQPITVATADVGRFGGFEVRQDLIDNIKIDPSLMGKTRSEIKLRSQAGRLSFQSDADVEHVTIPYGVIELIGDSIDLRSGEPIFQLGDNPMESTESPHTLVMHTTGTTITNASIPTEANYPETDETPGPELLVLRSDHNDPLLRPSVELLQRQLQQSSGNVRGWDFPVQGDLVLMGPIVRVIRNDGFDAVLTDRDHILADTAALRAIADPTASVQPPVSFAQVEVARGSQIRAYDPRLEFLGDDAVTFVDGKIDSPTFDLRSTPRFGIAQEAEFKDDSLLPFFGLNLNFQPETYALESQRGSINVSASKLRNTNLELVVVDPREQINFPTDEALVVNSLIATKATDEVNCGRECDFIVTPGAMIRTLDDGLIQLVAGIQGATNGGRLRFGSGVTLESNRVVLATTNEATSLVDARTHSPSFLGTKDFAIRQGGAVLNGLGDTMDPDGLLDYGLVPAASQFGDDPLELDRYQIITQAGDIELNDLDEIMIATTVELAAGDFALTLRAPGDDENLVLLGDGSFVETLTVQAGDVSLEAPNGYVDAGDSRIRFLFRDGDSFAIRQGDLVGLDDSGRLVSGQQFTTGTPQYTIESTTGIEIGPDAASRLENLDLVLSTAGTEDAFVTIGSDAAGAELTDLVLNSLTIESLPDDDAPIKIGFANITTQADQVYFDNVVLNAAPKMVDGELVVQPVVFAARITEGLDPTETPPASSVTFKQSIDGTNRYEQGMIVEASDDVIFEGNIGDVVELGLFQINLQQIPQFTTAPPLASAEFRGFGDFSVSAKEILLNPEAGNANSPFFRRNVPAVPTFTKEGGSLYFTTGKDGVFVLGQNEKISANGDGITGSTLRIDLRDPNAPDQSPLLGAGTATFGDLSAQDLIEVFAKEIHLLRRSGGPVLRSNGSTVTDPGADLVASEIELHFDFDKVTDPTGSNTLKSGQRGKGRDITFAIDNTALAPQFMKNFNVFSIFFNELAGSSDGARVLDGRADGISRTQLGRLFWGRPERSSLAVPANYIVYDAKRLAMLDLDLIEAEPEEIRARASGAAIYHDLDSLPHGRQRLVTITEDRLVAEEIELAMELYEEIFGADGSRTPEVRKALEGAARDYRRSTGARRIVGFELRRYIYNRPSSQFEAYQALQGLDALFRHHRRSGLTPIEYGTVQKKWLEAIQLEGISVAEMSELVHPSRYVRGSDVLDVFGD